MVTAAMMVPRKVETDAIVAVVPTCQNTLDASAPLTSRIERVVANVSVVDIMKRKVALPSPCASSVRSPVRMPSVVVAR
jgi:hypothetical protein